MALLTAAAVPTLLVGCGSDDPAPHVTSLETGDGGVAGQSLSVSSGVAFPADTAGTLLRLVSYADACTTTLSRPNATTLEIQLPPEIGHGTYIPGINASARLTHLDDQCRSTLPGEELAVAKGSTITVDEVDGAHVKGTYVLQLADGAVRGAFDVPYCAKPADAPADQACL